MKLKNIKISNYRCFKKAEIDFDDHITLVVGKNGAGKTAILDTIAVSVSTFLLGIDGGVSRSILKEDARYEFHNLNGTIDPQHQFPVIIETMGDCLNRSDIKWTRSLNSESGKTTVKDAGELTGLAKKAQNQIMTGDKSLVLPLISYYGTGRLYAQKKEKRNLKSLTEFKRQVGYVDCMAAESNEKLMLNWFQMQTLKSLQEQQKTGMLERPLLLKTVEKAICRSFERISDARNTSLFFELDTHRLVLEFESADGSAQKFAMDEMSDGYKNTLSMIGDIAYRMAVLNPTLGDQVLEKTPGVVLIDEIDLHLHPQWQQTILSDLHASLCAYCMKKIAAPSVMRIEHCRPRHPGNEQEHDKKATLDFKWMLGVCYGNSIVRGVKPEDKTCDAHRGNTELTVNPFDEMSVRKIKYKADGRIYSDDVDINKDVTETLNLNCQALSLPQTRKNVLMAEKNRIMRKCRGKSQDTFMRELERTYASLMQERNLTPYCGIIISWLERKLKIS